MTIEIGIAVKLHNVCFGVFFLDFRSQKDLYDLSRKSALLSEIGIFNYLLCNRTTALGHVTVVLYQRNACTHGSDPVYTVMVLETAVFLGNIAVLQVHAYFVDRYVLVVSCIDQTDLVLVLVINDRVG